MFPHTILKQIKHPADSSPLTSEQLIQVAQAAERKLHSDPRLYHHNIRTQFHEGVLTLDGQLPSYFLKQVAQELVTEIDGVLEIVNRIEVVSTVNYPIPR